jgi:hypothetical protein
MIAPRAQGNQPTACRAAALTSSSSPALCHSVESAGGRRLRKNADFEGKKSLPNRSFTDLSNRLPDALKNTRKNPFIQ